MRRDESTLASSPPLPVTAVLRHRLPWLLAAALVGAGLGVAGTSGATYAATAVLRLEAGTADGVRAQQQAQTLEQVVGSNGILAPAAAQTGAAVEDLRARTTVTWEQGTGLVDVVVVSETADAAVADANAVAAAAVQVSREAAAARSQALQQEADRVLDGEQLADPTAETARRERLGAATAEAQADAVASSGAVTVAETATSAVDAGLSPMVGAALGAAGIALLAGALALLLGPRRLRPRSSGELASLAPDLDVRPLSAAPELSAFLLENQRTSLAVVALPGAEGPADELAQQVADLVRAHGRDVDLLLEAGAPTSSPQAIVALRRPRGGAVQGPLHVVSLNASSDGCRLLAGRTEPAVAVVAQRGNDLRSIRRAVLPLRRAQTAVVLAP